MIYCIGNSHLNTFSFTSGFANFRFSSCKNIAFFHLGPVIAYNFYEKHFPKVREKILPKVNKEDDYLLFVVGEVDCRLHIPKQADIQRRCDEEIVEECVSRFSRIYDILQGYKILVFGTHPTTTEAHSMEDMSRPIYDSMQRRNSICVLWNNYMEKTAQKRGFPFFSIYSDLVDSQNSTKMEYFMDYCHLDSMKVKPFILREFKKMGINLFNSSSGKVEQNFPLSIITNLEDFDEEI